MTHRLVDVRPLGDTVLALTFDRPAEKHEHAGQVVVVKDPQGRAGYFALASAPGEPASLWVRPQGDAAAWLASLAPGTEVAPLCAIGGGFPTDADPQRAWLVLVTGTGLAAVRALVEARLTTASPSSVTVIHGARSEADRPGADMLQGWADRGVTVTRTVSGAPRVQALGMSLLHDPRVAVYAAGPKGLLEDADAARAACGGDAVRRNF
jgi:NAD(P)H-flavin reductase